MIKMWIFHEDDDDDGDDDDNSKDEDDDDDDNDDDDDDNENITLGLMNSLQMLWRKCFCLKLYLLMRGGLREQI